MIGIVKMKNRCHTLIAFAKTRSLFATRLVTRPFAPILPVRPVLHVSEAKIRKETREKKEKWTKEVTCGDNRLD